MKSPAALAAKAIKAEIKKKFPNLKVSVKSENFAGGNAVDVRMMDQSKAVEDLIRIMVSKYQYGKFDGMTDSYDYTNYRDDIPQVKYTMVSNPMSREKCQEIYSRIRQEWDGGEELPESYAEGRAKRLQGMWISDMVYGMFKESI